MKTKRKKHLKVAGVITFIVVSVIVVLTQNNTTYYTDAQYQKKPGGYSDFFRTITVPIGQDNSGYLPGYRLHELEHLKKAQSVLKSSFSDTLVWTSRGPVNVGGRTRSILVDPDDPEQKTWYAGTAGGGIWKTTDAGQSWTDLTPDLPNLSTVALSMAASNHDVIYAGTGEGFGGVGMITGDGIFKTEDRGTTWNRIESTRHEDFYYINDILVDLQDENELLVATNRGIYHTSDGGAQWDTVYKTGFRVQDLARNPGNPLTIYAAVNTLGVIRSNDGGLTWNPANEGISDVRRLSLAISPVDTSWVYASAELRSGDMTVFISRDAGENWVRTGKDDAFFNFHGAQGWYNNTISADPYLKNKAYVGGVYVGALTFEETIEEGPSEILSTDTVNTSSFLDFINFGGFYFGGGMSTGLEEGADVTEEDFVSVELRFGPGRTQKAHRFQVPDGEGPGVPRNDYAYFDYIEVPFEVWDITNNRQLMVSVRDQERDGAFNLIERDPDDPIPGREYIFIHAVDYDENIPDDSIARTGGHYYKMMYFFWPTLAGGGVWDPNNLPESMISIEFGSYPVQMAKTEVISSTSVNTNLHVDHHQLVILPGDSETDDHTMISANDGGVAVSNNTGQSWEQLTNGFYTTQFYGVAKRAGKDVFIGGMQDNGTWMSPGTAIATDSVEYSAVLGGDGFEVLWHPETSSKIIGSIYNNNFFVSLNSGVFWQQSIGGLGTSGPFISKLSHSRSRPDTIYTIDAEGVYMHPLFGSSNTNWQLTSINEGLAYYGTASSAIDVEVSEAEPSIVWAGQGMFSEPLLDIFVSEDYGESFSPVQQYTEVELGFISAIETHPVDPGTAFLLFSYHGKPKILRTTDLGESWQDISGFGTDSVSNNGFPDVVVLSLLVMPHDPNVIWAGTEIGIVESVDNGVSWHLLDSDFPNVSVYQMFYQDDMIVLATHGRGIWTAGDEVVIPEDDDDNDDDTFLNRFVSSKFKAKLYPNPADTDLMVSVKGGTPGRVYTDIYAVSGRLVRSDKHELITSEQVLRLDVSNITPGNYILKIRNEAGTTAENLIIR